MKLRTERDRVAHLLRRFGLGASEAEVEYYGKGGLKGAVDLLLNYENAPTGPVLDVDVFTTQKGALKPQSIRSWWLHRLVTTQRPLEEKMTLFWHDHFATSVNKVDNPSLMYHQNEILREHATGSFLELLTAVSKDAAMMFWLDNQLNKAGKPNENFGREVMELFTLGVGNYTEKDVQEAARAFTGWAYTQRRGKKVNENSIKGGQAEFVFNEADHDAGVKTVLGNAGKWTGEDVLGILTHNPQCARFLTRKIWTWFAYPEAADSTLEPFAAKFRASNLDIKTLLRAIMESEEFYSDRSAFREYKTPIDFTVATLRQLGLGAQKVDIPEGTQIPPQVTRPLQLLATSTKAMGMELFNPPDVAGWDGGASWISSATMVERIRWADHLFGSPPGGAPVKQSLRIDASSLFTDGTPLGVARTLASIFDANLPDLKLSKVAEGVEQATGGAVTPRNANAAANAAARLLFGSPEFQFC